jgi:DNA-directed RNA polymerase specialized sigma24 family protein
MTPSAGDAGTPLRPRARDVFPTTQATRIGTLLAAGPQGRLAAGRHVMVVYAHPLEVYLTGSSFRRLGEAPELVEGFFADRLGRERFLEDWLGSGRRLRHWLIRAFKNYLHEQIRAEKRQRRPAERDRYEAPPLDLDADDAEALFHREAAVGIVREAFRLAEQDCSADDLEAHWRVFVRHHLDGLDYRALESELNVPAARAKVMARTAANRFRARLREAIAWGGAQEQEIDLEIQALMESLER